MLYLDCCMESLLNAMVDLKLTDSFGLLDVKTRKSTVLLHFNRTHRWFIPNNSQSCLYVCIFIA